MLTRRKILVSCILASACSRAPETLTAVLPVEVQRAWKLKQTEPLPAEEAPPLIRGLGLKRAAKGIYTGNGQITVSLYEMNVEASAFELIQKWPQQDGLAMYKGSYFIVTSAQGADRATLSAFLQAFRESLP
jgi:hypothetical protein